MWRARSAGSPPTGPAEPATRSATVPNAAVMSSSPLGPAGLRPWWSTSRQSSFSRSTSRRPSCSCGEHIVTAKAPRRVFEKSSYGPGFIAHLITAKCADTIRSTGRCSSTSAWAFPSLAAR